MKTALVLEGGAMRGMYTAGVLDVFIENGIKFDAVIGVSAGALFGVNYLSGQNGRAIRYNKKYCNDKNINLITIQLGENATNLSTFKEDLTYLIKYIKQTRIKGEKENEIFLRQRKA